MLSKGLTITMPLANNVTAESGVNGDSESDNDVDESPAGERSPFEQG